MAVNCLRCGKAQAPGAKRCPYCDFDLSLAERRPPPASSARPAKRKRLLMTTVAFWVFLTFTGGLAVGRLLHEVL